VPFDPLIAQATSSATTTCRSKVSLCCLAALMHWIDTKMGNTMKNYTLALLFVALLVLFSSPATASPIAVTFLTEASIDGGAFFTSANWNSAGMTGDSSNNFTVNFLGDSYTVSLDAPEFEVDSIFGQFWVTKSRNGGESVDDIPFMFRITQTAPYSSDSISFDATFGGTIKGSGSVILNFADFSDGITSTAGTVTYSILDASKSITVNNTGESNIFDIHGHLAVDAEGFAPLGGDPAPVPEPGSLLLLGTGLASLAALGWRRRHK
jgi:hypothetical protein